MISVLCVTKRETFALPFLDRMRTLAQNIGGEYIEVVDGWDVKSNGTIESVLDEAIGMCNGEWILRLDDDEAASPALEKWLKIDGFTRDHYAFPRLNLWQDEQHYIANPPLYPDVQTRFSHREKAGNRKQVHEGSPFGTGAMIDAPILHYKFLARSLGDRREIAERYESLRPGAGMGVTYLPFNLPELAFSRLNIKEVK